MMEFPTSKLLGSLPSSILVVLVSSIALTLWLSKPTSTNGGLKILNDPIPRFFNTIQFIFDNYRFMTRAQLALQGGHNLLRFHLGPKTVYLVLGQQNIRTMFGRDLVHEVTNQEQMTQYALPTLYRMNPDEVRRWENDKSGVIKTPIPGTEDTPTRQRLWYMYEHIYAEYIGKPQYMKPLVDRFGRDFNQTLLKSYPLGEWKTTTVQTVCRYQVAEAAINTLFGPDLVKLNPDFLDRFWAFDENVFKLILGLPTWMDRGPSRAHDRYVSAVENWLDHAAKGFVWDRPEEAEADWEPRFGGRAIRELFRWMTETHWRGEVIAATLGALAFALNSNSVPTTTWMLMEIIQDPDLLQAVRDEVATAMLTGTDGRGSLDTHKLVALPLLQSIWTETLRLHINFNINRDVKQPITLEGHTIAKGSMLQAPMMVAHYNETVWGAQGHAASEFWAERHIKYTQDEHGTSKRTYAMAGHPTSYFPFGGGANICPGRQLAKYEALTTIALIVSQFDIELEGWINKDGSLSARPAQSDLRYSGAGAMPPDRDMRIKWKRIVKDQPLVVTT